MYEQRARDILAKNIKKYRKNNKISQEKLSEFLDTTAQEIFKIEHSDINVTIDYIGRIADVLNVSLEQLFSEEM